MRVNKICVFCSLCLSLSVDKTLYARVEITPPFSRISEKNAAKHSSLAGAQSHEKVDNEEATRGLCLSLNIDKDLRTGGPFSRVFGKNAAKHSSLAHGAQSHEKVYNEEAPRGQTQAGQGLSSWGSKF
jgi:hypothetical protein